MRDNSSFAVLSLVAVIAVVALNGNAFAQPTVFEDGFEQQETSATGSCADPIALPTAANFDTFAAGAQNDFSWSDYAGCPGSLAEGAPYDGNDLVFTIVIPVGQTLTLTAIPETSWDPAVVISTDCSDVNSSCLVGEDSHFNGIPETAQYSNPGGADLQIFVIIDAFDSFSGGPFTVSAELQ